MKASLQRQITELFGWDESNSSKLIDANDFIKQHQWHAVECKDFKSSDNILAKYIPLENVPEFLEALQEMFTLQGDRIVF